MDSVAFSWYVGRTLHSIVVSGNDARAKAIDLAEQLMLDKISNVTYTIKTKDGYITKDLDYYNDIL